MPLPISEIVIWPISLVSGSSVIYISSQVVKRDSIINELISLRHPDTGRPMVSSQSYSTMCPRCKLHNYTNCKHDVFMPQYFDGHRMLLTTMIMKRNPDAYRREIRNEYTEQNLRCPFNHANIEKMLTPAFEYYDNISGKKEVYVVIDPAAGGVSSRYAIVSLMAAKVTYPNNSYEQTHMVILGAENCEERDPVVHKSVLIEHLENVRKIPGFKDCTFVIMPESNMALATSHIHEHLKQKLTPDEFFIIQEDNQNKGFRTDNGLKQLGTSILKEVLEYNQIRFHHKFFTCPMGKNLERYTQSYISSIDTHPQYLSEAINTPDSTARELVLKVATAQLKDEIVRQLKDWKEEVVLDARGGAKTFYGGKHQGKPDDLAMCLVGGIVVIRKYRYTVAATMAEITSTKRQDSFDDDM